MDVNPYSYKLFIFNSKCFFLLDLMDLVNFQEFFKEKKEMFGYRNKISKIKRNADLCRQSLGVQISFW